MSDEHFMQLAIAEARKALAIGEVPIGAIVVKDSKVIGSGYNQTITNNSPCAHAEVLALESAAKHTNNYRLNLCKLYVTLEPCMMCAGAIAHARIDQLIFGAFDPKTGVIKTCDELLDRSYLNHWVKSKGGVCEDECKTMLQSFFKKRR